MNAEHSKFKIVNEVDLEECRKLFQDKSILLHKIWWKAKVQALSSVDRISK